MCALRIRCASAFCLFFAASAVSSAGDPPIDQLLARVGLTRGVCAVPNCGDGDLAIPLAAKGECLVHAFDADRQNVAKAIERAQGAGLSRHRIVVECIVSDRLPYADNFVDILVTNASRKIPMVEVFRVVRPRGYALIHGDTEVAEALRRAGLTIEEPLGNWTVARKPTPPGVDDWSHWSHGPDNNPVSTDTVIQAPYLTQWLGEPYYHAMPVVTTAAAGRLFIASGHIAHHDREIPTLNTLVARNAYNGRVLWSRELPEGYLVHRSAFSATDDAFYMLDGDGVLVLDPQTGRQIERLQIPGVDGTLLWMAKVASTLYLLAGPREPPTETMKVHATFRGWGWIHVDKNYSPQGKHQIRWGFGNQIVALDLDRHETTWTHEQTNIDSRGMGILDHKLFYYVPSKQLACLDRRTGHVVWRNEDRERLSLIEQEAQGLVGTPGFRTTAMLLATPVGLFVQGQKRTHVVAFSVTDGRFLWSRRKFHNNPNMLYVDGRLHISGIEQNGAVQVIDPKTGESLENLNFWKGSCTRMTASPEALFCRGEGLGRYDFQKKLYTAERTARPGCNDGAIPAGGLLHVGPWLCDCNLSILGQMTLAPAGQFDAHNKVVANASLEVAQAEPKISALVVDDLDWPTYRANNQRTGSSPAVLGRSPHELWQCPPHEEQALQSQPVTVGGLIFTAGEDGYVRCISAESGAVQWRLATGGPVIASPTVWQGRLFVGSGDGYVYCVEASTGELIWRFRVAPVERRINVYGRLASNWPVNSGVLVHNRTAYAAAGIIFRDGTHVVALDATTGRLRWHNGSAGKPLNEAFELQAASALGTLAIGAGRLWLASGNVVAPVSFELATGQAEVVPAHRVPTWNTVMAQKPEPSGRDIMVFADRFLMHGGRLLYSDPGPVVSSAQFNFRAINDDGRVTSPAFTPVRHCAVAPAWDDQVFVTPSSRYGDVLAWSTKDAEKRLLDAKVLMTDMDSAIPGESPEKWGQYGRIGQVFSAVERRLRSTSLWPAAREDVYGVAVVDSAVVLTGKPRNQPRGYFVAARDKADGELLWKLDLPREPTLGGLAVDREGRILIPLRDGALMCVGH